MTPAILRLTILAACCGLLLSTVYALTREDIRQNRRAFEIRQLREVVGDDKAVLVRLDDDLFAVEKDGERRGFVFETRSLEGYNGRIELWMAVDNENEITGVRVKSHQETPGLGDKLELSVSDWILSFDGKSLRNPPAGEWKVRKDGGQFDQFTGATITPRAVVAAIKAGLERADAARSRWSRQGGEP